jgi:DNA invertase Pin-like site-specific DNA recombinase
MKPHQSNLAIIYTRYSPRPIKKRKTENGETVVDPCQSCERQEEICRAWCESRGWTVVAVYSDAGISGALGEDDRPALKAALEHVRKVNGNLVCYCLSRFARSTSQFSRLMKDLLDDGCFLASVRESIDLASPAGRLLAHMLGAFAEFEREMIVERTSERMLLHQRNGRAMSASTPYGYVRDDGNPSLMNKEPAEWRTMRRIVRMHKKGLSNREIARTLDKLGAPCRGKKWHHRLVGKIVDRHLNIPDADPSPDPAT